MITSNTKYAFGGKVATVETPSFCCMISTAKEGIFKRQSVMFSDFSEGMQNRKHIAKLVYNEALDSKARLDFHDTITVKLDEAGKSGQSLNEALHAIFDDLKTEMVGFGALLDEL